MMLVEIGARHDVLVHADGPVHLAAAPIQGAERKVRVDRLVIEVGEPEEHLERSIGLVVEQEPHALQIALAASVAPFSPRERCPCRNRPADGERACQRQPENADRISEHQAVQARTSRRRRGTRVGWQLRHGGAMSMLGLELGDFGEATLGESQGMAQPSAFCEQFGYPARTGECTGEKAGGERDQQRETR